MDPISSLSRPYVYAWIDGAAGIEAVEIAFTVPGDEPSEEGWHTASWSGVTAKGADARILIGPGGDVTLPEGTYQMWVRVDAPPERPMMPSGLVFII
ncbi:hypothetical protein ACFQYP_00545 [Nonomuraea antimicrobica]